MSDSMQTNGIAVTQFQKRFGAAPGGQDPKAECEKWQRLCEDLLAERSQLRAELDRFRLEEICRECESIPIPSWEEMQTQIDRSTTLEQVIQEIERDAEKET